MFTLDHVAIAVLNLDKAVEMYCKLLTYPAEAVEYHEVPSEQVRVAMLKGNTTIELLECTDPTGNIARFIEKRGPGLHHLCFRTSDTQVQLDALVAAGFALLDQQPRIGAEGSVFFVHPKSAGGVLMEFVQPDSIHSGEQGS
jgi:methylmalonyl-CoA/ethylmalonyl-CoA epimerase